MFYIIFLEYLIFKFTCLFEKKCFIYKHVFQRALQDTKIAVESCNFSMLFY